MKLSAFTIVDGWPPEIGAGRDRYREVVELAGAADRAGLSALWVAEHHFHTGGVVPSPPVVLAACGERTRRLRLGIMVGVLPFHEPIRFAEELALLDRLIGGRLNLGIGSGYLAAEFEGFGIDPREKRERFDRSLDTILRAFRGEEVRVDGDRGRPVRLNVTPLQQPHPPIWVAVQRREAIRHVAERGLSIGLIPYATVSSLGELAEEIREFRAHLPAGSTAEVAVALHVYAGARLPQAREAFQRYLDSRRATRSAFYEEKVRADPHQARAEAIEESGLAVLGSPSEVEERLDAIARIGVDELLGIFDFGGLPLTDVKGSVAALARSSGL